MSCPSLKKSQEPGVSGPVLAIVMDGVGIGAGDVTDAVAQAHTPHLDALARGPLATSLAAHGTSVGMPSDGDMGNSEVGHNALGAGRVFAQGAKLVQDAVRSGRIFESETWGQIVRRCASGQGALHLIGLLSDGNVHSHIDHVVALIDRADAEGIRKLYVHPLLDGRDVPKHSALDYVDQLEAALAKHNAKPDRRYKVASGGGRMTTTMDRYEADWSMVERGWKSQVHGEGRGFSSLREAVETLREESPGITDQDLGNFIITEAGEPVAAMQDGDAVIAFNFRGDRMLELTSAFELDDFAPFDRGRRPEVFFCGMTLYDGDTQRPRNFLVSPPEILCTLGELLCDAGVTQLACSETQKFGHVTYFWNGNRSGAFNPKLERYIEIPSYDPPFDERPEMRAPEIADVVAKEISGGAFRFARINLANGDMVGHTGNFDATVRAMESVDSAVGQLVEAVLKARGAVVVTADHGNADDMYERDKKGQLLRDASGAMVAKTSHSLNPVPFYVALTPADQARFELNRKVEKPGLGHVAATLSTLLGFQQPEAFLPSLVQWKM